MALKGHGDRTAYVVMVDGDHTLEAAWRLRFACERLSRECARMCVILTDRKTNNTVALVATGNV